MCARIVSGELTLEAACASSSVVASEIEDWLLEFRQQALVEFDAHLKQSLLQQGAHTAAQTSAKFTGTLDEISVGDMIQTIQIAAKDAVITVSVDGVESRIWCAAGTLVDAESGLLRGEVALYRILGFDQGHMVADLRSAPRARAITEPTHRLLLEGLRRKDELRELERQLGDIDRCYISRGGADLDELSRAECAVLEQCSVPRSLRELLAASPLGDWETARAVSHLIKRGQLEPAPGAPRVSSAPAAQERPSALSFLPLSLASPPRRARVGRWLWAAAGLTALIPLAFWSGRELSEAYPASAAAASPQPSVRSLAPAPELPVSDTAAEQAEGYVVALRVEPAGARIWLDGREVGASQLKIVLAKDGARHELRAAAEGYIPAHVWFTDVAPPAELQLEPLPSAAAAAAQRGTADAIPKPSSASGRAKKRKPATHAERVDHGIGTGQAPPNATPEPPSPQKGLRAGSARVSEADVPRIQVIE